MKRKLFFLVTLMLITLTIGAKDIKTIVLTTAPQMHCENCENKIKNNVRFVKGVKSIDTNVEAQTVTIKYDADKTSPEKISEGFAKIGYTVSEVDTTEKEKTDTTEKDVVDNSGKCDNM